MDDRSTISWMMIGGLRNDARSRADLDHLRALRERDLEASLGRRRDGRLARLVGFLDGWASRPSRALTADFCNVEPCVAA